MKGSEAYRILNPTTRRVRTVRNIVVDEGRGWTWDSEQAVTRHRSTTSTSSTSTFRSRGSWRPLGVDDSLYPDLDPESAGAESPCSDSDSESLLPSHSSPTPAHTEPSHPASSPSHSAASANSTPTPASNTSTRLHQLPLPQALLCLRRPPTSSAWWCSSHRRPTMRTASMPSTIGVLSASPPRDTL
jgi:hypothetical protein